MAAFCWSDHWVISSWCRCAISASSRLRIACRSAATDRRFLRSSVASSRDSWFNILATSRSSRTRSAAWRRSSLAVSDNAAFFWAASELAASALAFPSAWASARTPRSNSRSAFAISSNAACFWETNDLAASALALPSARPSASTPRNTAYPRPPSASVWTGARMPEAFSASARILSSNLRLLTVSFSACRWACDVSLIRRRSDWWYCFEASVALSSRDKTMRSSLSGMWLGLSWIAP